MTSAPVTTIFVELIDIAAKHALLAAPARPEHV